MVFGGSLGSGITSVESGFSGSESWPPVGVGSGLSLPAKASVLEGLFARGISAFVGRASGATSGMSEGSEVVAGIDSVVSGETGFSSETDVSEGVDGFGV